MRVSEYFNLNRTQPSLDFVDVDIRGDVPFFVDPNAVRLLPTEWGAECITVIQNFFRHVLAEIQEGRHENARNLLAALREPNEVHLGFSSGRSRGSALGTDSAYEVWDALHNSEAVQTGLLEDLEDTILMVPGISSDRVSDIAINLIRRPLIRYTQEQANFHGMSLSNDVDSGPLWNPDTYEWSSEYVQLPITNEGRLLLVPKSIVRRKMTYDADEYYRHYVLEFLRRHEFAANSALVQLLKNGNRRVTNKSLVEKYGSGKEAAAEITLKHPEILSDYRKDKRRIVRPTLTHSQIAENEGTTGPDWGELLRNVTQVPLGRAGEVQYEKAIEALLTALFYPALAHPDAQFRIHEDRKRIDIKYTNIDQSGFFWWLGQHYTAPHVFVECKNYSGEVSNPELDQLAGRFSPSRGQFGLLLCRKIADKDLFIDRCRDTANDGRGFIIPLDDSDLQGLVDDVHKSPEAPSFPMLRERFERLVK